MKFLRKSLYFVLAAVILGFGTYWYFTRDLPPLDTIQDYNPNLVTKVLSHDGRLIGEFYIERRVAVDLDRVPAHLINAFIAAEDAGFYEHEGISYSSIFRAFLKNLQAGRVVQGGSTITQQVAKSFFLSSEKTISRKVREAIMAFRIEKNLNKQEILHLYLNQIYLGSGAYGIQAASEAYFGKDVSELTLAESALLAGLPKAPSKYSPYESMELARKRQEYVLDRMVETNYLTRSEADRAYAEGLKLVPRRSESLWVGPYFTEEVRKHLEAKYGAELLYRGGLEVHTTLDVEMQRAANRAVDLGLREHDKRRGFRGPVKTLKTKEEAEAFRKEMEKKLLHDQPGPGKYYLAVVKSFSGRDRSLSVDIGGKPGVISAEDMQWARLYNPTREPDGGRQEDLRKILKAGDVVQVAVKAMPESAAAPLELRLEQEPLAQAALLAMEPETGAVKAMVGGFDYSKSQFNRAMQAMRQPGSAFKPIIYTAAMDSGLTPASIVMDSPVVFEDTEREDSWRPRNYDEQFYGPTTIREAIARSRNVITIKVLKQMGVKQALNYARLLGINSPLAGDLSLALGSSAVTLQELTVAFSTLANLGVKPAPLLVTRVVDRTGRVLEETGAFSTSVISPQTAYIMTSLLQGVVESGTGMRARALGRPVAGKTGTTNNLNDAWFIGYVPGLAAGAWVGYDDEKPLGTRETGSRAALPIWLSFMSEAIAGTPANGFPVPEGLEFARIDPATGLLANDSTKDAVFEVFKAGTAPIELSPARNIGGPSDFFMIDTDQAPAPRTRPDETEFLD
ncbi:MAG: PBP1A family penicillin-binding protein [Deltaproteobacteria bacterium]|nr:PBP1A family penicillin-binding protein [Deltaproteobacteria bacterium]MBZ0218997.1 PBP1A family penicillin-binding protein [Deltaproteobacteria bacterium]